MSEARGFVLEMSAQMLSEGDEMRDGTIGVNARVEANSGETGGLVALERQPKSPKVRCHGHCQARRPRMPDEAMGRRRLVGALIVEEGQCQLGKDGRGRHHRRLGVTKEASSQAALLDARHGQTSTPVALLVVGRKWAAPAGFLIWGEPGKTAELGHRAMELGYGAMEEGTLVFSTTTTLGRRWMV
ncbi:unnamed protein product [Ilex paraguariensis]|uniref:Uncharacterized protein n=1 Tax=Ilex paraguariensis TaxID=185542 RepID=A0ABC8RHC2_9AQUA